MICSHCGADNSPGTAICPACGGSLDATIPQLSHQTSVNMVAAPPDTLLSISAASNGGAASVPVPTRPKSREGDVLVRGAHFAGRYRIVSLLGKGGMGSVYLAHDENTDEDVCVKLMNPALMSSPEISQRFKQEGKLARKLSHPNIIRVFDIDRADDRWFISMEYVEGQSLREWLAALRHRGRKFSAAEVLAVAEALLAALEHAHAQGVVHRDIKPENVLLAGDPAKDSPGATIKLLDFGIARALSTGGPALTQEGDVIGTPNYMAPEQRAGQTVDARADLYSLGVVLFEMLTGVLFDGHWEALGNDCPPGLQAALRAALSKFPERRPQGAAEMRAMLRGAGGMAVEPASEVGDIYDRWRQLRRAGGKPRPFLEGLPHGLAEQLRPFAARGDAKAQVIFATLLHNGIGVPRQPEIAMQWFLAAANAGDAEAAFSIAMNKEFGSGLPPDIAGAIHWYTAAAMRGHAEAQYKLGLLYSAGKGVKQNSAEAMKWFRRAAEQGHTQALIKAPRLKPVIPKKKRPINPRLNRE